MHLVPVVLCASFQRREPRGLIDLQGFVVVGRVQGAVRRSGLQVGARMSLELVDQRREPFGVRTHQRPVPTSAVAGPTAAAVTPANIPNGVARRCQRSR